MYLVIFSLFLVQFIFTLLMKTLFDGIRERVETREDVFNLLFCLLNSILVMGVQLIWLNSYYNLKLF